MEPRKRKRLLIAFAGIVVFFAGLLPFLNRNTEPTYNGRPLSEWITIYGENVLNRGSYFHDQQQDAAIDAIRVIGTNGLPFLIHWIKYEPGPWRYRIGSLAERLPDSITGGSPLMRLTGESAGAKRAYYAMTAFKVLGSVGAPAISELTKCLQPDISSGPGGKALFALSCLGPAALHTVTNVLSTSHYAGDPWAMVCIQNLGTNARTMTPIVVGHLASTNEGIASMTALSFRWVEATNQLDPDLVVPALIKCLGDPRTEVRMLAPFALTTFGALAAPALPALTNALNDPHPRVSAGARDAIKAITGVAPARF